MTAEERRIDFYGDGDARAYDHDELYIMKEYAKDYHESEVKNLSSNTLLADRLPSAEDVKRWYQLLVGKGEIEMQKDIEATLR